MQSESISRERRTIENGLRNATDSAVSRILVEQEFFLDRFSLRAQFDWKVARRSNEWAADNTDAGPFTIFQAPSERIFTRDAMIEFLAQLRKKAARSVHARHASTPQAWVFRKGRHTWIEQDASVAPWRYMYFMGPRIAGTSMVVLIQTRHAILKGLPWFTRTRTAKVIAGLNDLIIFPSVAVQAVLCQPNSAELKDQTIVLSGWLW